MALLTKWAYRLMSSEVDLTTQVLKNNYGSWMDWERRMAPARGASVFWLGLRRVFLQLWKSFRANLGDRCAICYRLDDWMRRGILHQELPYSFSLARNHQATVGACWDGTLSNLRVEDYLRIQHCLIHLRPSMRSQDGWAWMRTSFSVHVAYKMIRHGKIRETRNPSGLLIRMETEGPPKSAEFC